MSGAAASLIRAGRPQPCRPHRRWLLEESAWARLPAALLLEPSLSLLGLWADGTPDGEQVHAAFHDPLAGGGAEALLLASVAARDGRFPALSPARPGAAPFERLARDLWGAAAAGGGAASRRPWADHGRWPFEAPLSARPVRRSASSAPWPEPEPPPAPGAARLRLGPVRGGFGEPLLLLATVRDGALASSTRDGALASSTRDGALASSTRDGALASSTRDGALAYPTPEGAPAGGDVAGEAVEAVPGFAHRGVIGLMLGKSPRGAARFAARLVADATVAHSWAFALAAEAALGVAVPPRAALLRAAMAEIERAREHLRHLAVLAGLRGAASLRRRCELGCEMLMRAGADAFGHRLLMDRVLPGGVAADLAEEGADALRAALRELDAARAGIERDAAPVIEGLRGVGPVPAAAAAGFAAGGPTGRASGRCVDGRRMLPLPPYDVLPPARPVRAAPGGPAGDAASRAALRLDEIWDALALLRALLDALEPGEHLAPLPAGVAGEGVGLTESPRGEALCWLALGGDGLIRAAFLRDPSWAQEPLLPLAAAGAPPGSLPLLEHSLALSRTGSDL